MLNKMNKIEIYVANEDTDINPSVQEAIEYVLKQNDPVGTVAGYYDEKLTIWSVSNYFLQLLGWDDLDEFMKASDGSMLSVVCNEQKHIFSPERLHDLQGSHILYLTDSKGLSIPVRIVKADARDNKGRPIWVLSVRSDHFARNQEAREAAFHRAFTDMNLCEYYVDLQENTFESMKVKGSLQEISNKSRTWDELIQMFLNNYVCPESKEAVEMIFQARSKEKEKYMAEIQVYANNRTGLLVDLSKIFTERKIDLRSINSRTSKQEKATISMSFEIGSKEELRSLIEKIRQVESVIDVERTTG